MMTEKEKHEKRLASIKVAQDAFRADGHDVYLTLEVLDERYVTMRDGETGDVIARMFFPQLA